MARVLCVLALVLASAFVATNGTAHASSSPCNRVYTVEPGTPALVAYIRCERVKFWRPLVKVV